MEVKFTRILRSYVQLDFWIQSCSERRLAVALVLLVGMKVSVFAQSKITGNITSDEGDTLPGVTVIVKGTSTGTITDVDGNFSIEAEPDDVLVFSFVGFETIERAVGTNTSFDVSLRLDISELSEVVVIGYGTQQKKDVSSAVSTIGSDNLNRTVNPRVTSAIQGKTSGVQVINNSGAPGSGLSFNIRGTGSYANSQPLILVDGTILTAGGLEYLNPNDIENITILKDAAATSIYGARGAHGVVLVTTKGGSGGGDQASVSYNGYYGVQEVAKKVDLLNAAQYALIMNESARNAGQEPLEEFANPSSFGDGVDWQDQIFETAPIQEHSISFSKGGSNTNTYTSLTYFDQSGIVGGDKARFKRITGTFNTNSSFGDRIKAGTNMTYSHSRRDNLPENSEFDSPITRALNYDPVTPLYLPNGEYAASKYTETDIRHPVNTIEQQTNFYVSDRLVGGANLSIEPIDGLFIEPKIGFDLQYGNNKSFTPTYELRTVDGQIKPNEQVLQNSTNRATSQNIFWMNEGILRYKRSFGDHNTETIVGYLVSQQTWQNVSGTTSDLIFNDPDNAFLDNGQDPTLDRVSGGYSRTRWRSAYARFLYDYKNKYYLTASFRQDESSKFGPNFRTGNFQAFSAGWDVTSESFFDVPFVNYLKLRAGWGQNGSDNAIGSYDYSSLIQAGYNYNLGVNETQDEVVVGAAPAVVANTDLRWETIEQTNVGLDMEVLDGVSLKTDFFIKKTKDMLAVVPIPLIVGAEASSQNAATMENRGFEIELGYKKRFGDLSLDIAANYTGLKNEITNLGTEDAFINSNTVFMWGQISRTEVGQPISYWYGWQTDGIFQNEIEINNHRNSDGELIQGNAVPGDFKFKDINGDGQINQDDRTFLGRPTPTKLFGLTTTATYKGFDFYVLFQGSAGNEIVRAFTRSDFNMVNQRVEVMQRWRGEGTSNSHPRVTWNDANGNNRFSDFFVEDGDFLRIKNIQLGYTLPAAIGGQYLTKARFYVSAQNLLTFTNYTGFDPEIGTQTHFVDDPLSIGVDRGFYPQSRMFIGGIQLTF